MKKILFLLLVLLSCEKPECPIQENKNCWICSFSKSDPYPITICNMTEEQIIEFRGYHLTSDNQGELQKINCTKQ